MNFAAAKEMSPYLEEPKAMPVGTPGKTGYLYLLVFLSFKIMLFLGCLYKCLVTGLFRLFYSVL